MLNRVAVKVNGLNPHKYAQWLPKETPNAKDPGGPVYLDSLTIKSSFLLNRYAIAAINLGPAC